MLHGRQRGMFDLTFRVPSECADLVASGESDIGIVPIYELLRRNWVTVPGVGIACRGAVRSILLISKVEAAEIRTLAGDSSSRTSIALARIILAEKYGVNPQVLVHAPELDPMLEKADAALMIGDPALRLDPASLPYRVYDLGAEWVEMTGLPMVFAVWAGREACRDPEVVAAFQDSCRFGLENRDRIIAEESARRGIDAALVRRYLTRHIVCELGEAEYKGMELYLRYARRLRSSCDRDPVSARSAGTDQPAG